MFTALVTGLALSRKRQRKLPMTAGQLYAFVYDSTAEPSRLTERPGIARKGVEAILDDLFKYE